MGRIKHTANGWIASVLQERLLRITALYQLEMLSLLDDSGQLWLHGYSQAAAEQVAKNFDELQLLPVPGGFLRALHRRRVILARPLDLRCGRFLLVARGRRARRALKESAPWVARLLAELVEPRAHNAPAQYFTFSL
ncbi:MAG: hypothetical protein H6707_02175 [Deltaproteobacteria bacterium]|nr:hypothetical protein [Deltaproteobacteria bacterium]